MRSCGKLYRYTYILSKAKVKLLPRKAYKLYVKRKINKVKFLFFILAIFVVVYVFYYQCVMPVIVLVCEENARIYAKNVINQTATEILAAGYYTDLLEINETATSSSEFIKTNTQLVNEIALRLSLTAQEKMQKNDNLSVSVPLGALTGIVFLSSWGPDIEIDIIPSGTIAYEYSTILKTSGINQVNYKIILNMITTVNLIIPGNHKQISVDSEVLLTDCIIAGRVPDVYVGSENTYDLIP